ncbi:hypothetical protein [Clostridium butyricum]|uniref:hypothetical protein n=1 Tax=Clostridium butyricum TaxID=1492 RepID=UPI0005C17A7F|nr:hypothetical protein [Clostridium butyricum]KIU07782.1 hypothetical protein SC08_Contig83orf01704 [Clostridium butyricum]MBA8967613.1 hypothetical protein [Clostridium butyricum]MBA8971320.1 hypothetical protein [Clostridium butyricum]MBC2429382.1 hypothetical protein [Clostridium butyricum]NOW36814.1 hypothetical protein [Clostridium butyricum]
MVYEIILSLMLILDIFGAVYVYKLLINYAKQRIEKKDQQKLSKIKENTTEIKRIETKISDDIKFESVVLCDEFLKILDAYR